MAHIAPKRTLADQPNKIPTRKISAGALAGSIVTILVAVSEMFDVVVEPEVAAAVTTLLTFVAGYLVRDRL